ncbi:MAG: DUF547 domain-containing protein [Maricaulaceae bacterium]
MVAFGASAPAIAADWSVYDENSVAQLDNQAWSVFLETQTQVDRGRTLVGYKALNTRALSVLDSYISGLERIPVSQLNKNEQLAFWLNLHNALTVKTLYNAGGNGDVDRHRTFPQATDGPFAKKTVTIEGQLLSIDDIVNVVLRPNFEKPMLHYGLFYGAEGSTPLRREAYTGAKVEEQLADLARTYVNSNDGVKAGRRKIQVSAMYDWYRDDFGGSDEAILTHVAQFAEGRTAERLAGRTEIDRFNYDFDMAAFAPRPQPSASSFQNAPGGGFAGGGGGGGGFGGGS